VVLRPRVQLHFAHDWSLTLVFGIGAGLTSILIMLLYVTNDAAPSGFYREIAGLYVIPAAMRFGSSESGCSAIGQYLTMIRSYLRFATSRVGRWER